MVLQGCIHGEIDAAIDTARAELLGEKQGLLIWAGDVQSVRGSQDLLSLAVPPKYRAEKDFPAYYRGEKTCPFPTVFIGGNHENSRVLADLPLGGWTAPNIWYGGRVGVLRWGKMTIGFMSGIYNRRSENLRDGERHPFTSDTLRTVYHQRSWEKDLLKRFSGGIDLMLSHDWPCGVVQSPQAKADLVRRKPYFADELRRDALGSPLLRDLLESLRPRFWAAAHLHVTFNSVYNHTSPSRLAPDGSLETGVSATTHFLTHDKLKGDGFHQSVIYRDEKEGSYDYKLTFNCARPRLNNFSSVRGGMRASRSSRGMLRMRGNGGDAHHDGPILEGGVRKLQRLSESANGHENGSAEGDEEDASDERKVVSKLDIVSDLPMKNLRVPLEWIWLLRTSKEMTERSTSRRILALNPPAGQYCQLTAPEGTGEPLHCSSQPTWQALQALCADIDFALVARGVSSDLAQSLDRLREKVGGCDRELAHEALPWPRKEWLALDVPLPSWNALSHRLEPLNQTLSWWDNILTPYEGGAYAPQPEPKVEAEAEAEAEVGLEATDESKRYNNLEAGVPSAPPPPPPPAPPPTEVFHCTDKMSSLGQGVFKDPPLPEM